MRKTICILMSAVILVASLSISVFADNEIKVYINGERIEFDTEPTIINGRTFVPIRAVCEKLGADVYWWEENEVVVIVKNDIKILLQIENNEMVRFECRDYEHYYGLSKADKINEYAKEIGMDVTPVILNGRTLLPIRYVCEELGATVEWVATTSTVNIKCSNDTLQSPNTDKSFFDKMYFCDVWPTPEILAIAQTNEERIEKAIYFLELYFKTCALIHTEVSSVDDLYLNIENTTVYKMIEENFEYNISAYSEVKKEFIDEVRLFHGRNIDYIVEFKGITNDKSYHTGGILYYKDGYTPEKEASGICDYIYRVTFYKNGTCRPYVHFEQVNNPTGLGYELSPFPYEKVECVYDYGPQYNQTITYPSSDGGVHIFGV